MVKVSIIVPVYNVEKYIEKCLESLINQTLKEIELIIINDGSLDNSQKIIDKYAKKDVRIKSYIKENGGLSDARNYGMKKATGEYIAFVDSDDYIDLEMMEVMYKKALKDKADIVECDFIWEYESEKRIDKSKLDKNKLISIRVLAPNKIYKRELIEKNNITFPKGLIYEDVAFCYTLLPFVHKISSVDAPFYHYVQRKNSIVNTQNEKVRDIYKILDIVLNFYKEKEFYNNYKNELEYIYMRYILRSSLMRAIRIKAKKLRNEILKEGYDLLNKNFPSWRENKFLKEYKGLRNFYFKTINKFTYFTYAFIFRLVGFDKWQWKI